MLQFLRCLGSGFVFSSGARAVCLRIKGFKVARVVLTRFESDVEKMEDRIELCAEIGVEIAKSSYGILLFL